MKKLSAEDYEAILRQEGLAPLDDGEAATYRAEASSERKAALASELRREFWRRAEIAAADLPYGWPRGHFIRYAVQLGNVNRAARELKITQKAGEWAWRKFLVFAGLPAPAVKGSPGRKRPTRTGQRRVEAGRYRGEQE